MIVDYDSKTENAKKEIEETKKLIEKAIKERENDDGKREKRIEELQ